MVVRSEAGLTLWNNWLGIPAIRGFFGALMGYFAGCTVVWATRIVGTLGFGREAMGLGDVHLMGAAEQ
jgi:leader peptidase (prepilin peptidase)/N-methyltransferase